MYFKSIYQIENLFKFLLSFFENFSYTLCLKLTPMPQKKKRQYFCPMLIIQNIISNMKRSGQIKSLQKAKQSIFSFHGTLNEAFQKQRIEKSGYILSEKLKLRDYLFVTGVSSKQKSKEKQQRYSSAKPTRLSTTQESPIKNPSAKKSLIKSRKYDIKPNEILKAVKTEIHENLKEMGQAIESLKQIIVSNLGDLEEDVGEEMMIILYDMHHKLKNIALPEIKSAQQKLERKTQILKTPPKLQQSIDTQSQMRVPKIFRPQERPTQQDQHKVCLFKRRGTARN